MTDSHEHGNKTLGFVAIMATWQTFILCILIVLHKCVCINLFNLHSLINQQFTGNSH
jgi:hypothetical protein